MKRMQNVPINIGWLITDFFFFFYGSPIRIRLQI